MVRDGTRDKVKLDEFAAAVCTKNHIRIGNAMESPKLAE